MEHKYSVRTLLKGNPLLSYIYSWCQCCHHYVVVVVVVFVYLGLHEVHVSSVEEAMLILRLGLKHRHVASTRLNYQSSRSHSIYTIKLVRLANVGKPSRALINRLFVSPEASLLAARGQLIHHTSAMGGGSCTHSFQIGSFLLTLSAGMLFWKLTNLPLILRFLSSSLGSLLLT